MKRASVFVLAGTVAGFVGVLSFHTRPATPTISVGRATSAGHTSHAKGRAVSEGSTGGSASSTAVRSALGATEQYGYGELAVKVVIRGNRITNVTVPLIQTAESYSQQLAVQVIPTLRSEVLTGQTANISTVSGATYTSQAYAVSLQAALDKLHIK